jgi:hypothetical protein
MRPRPWRVQRRGVGRDHGGGLKQLAVADGAVAGQRGSGRDQLGQTRGRDRAQVDARPLAEHLAAAGVDAGHVHAVPAEQGVKRADAVDRHGQGEAKRAGRRQADPQAGEGARPGADHDRLQLRRLHGGRAHQVVDVVEQVLGGG